MALKRDLIMQAVVTRMQGILTSGGYYSNLGSKVFEWRPKVLAEGGASYVPTEQDELPALHIRDPIDAIVRVDLKGNEDHELNGEFEIAHAAGDTPQEMRQQIEDVRAAIGTDYTWGGYAKKTAIDAPIETVRIQADRTFFRTLIRAKIFYSTSAFNEE